MEPWCQASRRETRVPCRYLGKLSCRNSLLEDEYPKQGRIVIRSLDPRVRAARYSSPATPSCILHYPSPQPRPCTTNRAMCRGRAERGDGRGRGERVGLVGQHSMHTGTRQGPCKSRHAACTSWLGAWAVVTHTHAKGMLTRMKSRSTLTRSAVSSGFMPRLFVRDATFPPALKTYGIDRPLHRGAKARRDGTPRSGSPSSWTSTASH